MKCTMIPAPEVGWLLSAGGTLALWMALFGATLLYSHQQPAQSHPIRQTSYDTPSQAVEALTRAAEQDDVGGLLKIFGPTGADIVSTGDDVADKNVRTAFVQKVRENKRIVPDRSQPKRATLYIGSDDWPFPVPLLKQGNKWRFDSDAGRDEILARRIGRNELNAIAICLGYVEAQREYASEIHDGKGPNQYAQRLISTPGKHDGLYWKDVDGSSGGPIGEIVAKGIQEGYTTGGKPFHGYYFKILKGQGAAAPIGKLDFVVDGAMIGGFALVAAPARYRVTGVQTFMVSHNGVVYQKDLGPDTLALFERMDRYNPDGTWKRTTDEYAMKRDDGQ